MFRLHTASILAPLLAFSLIASAGNKEPTPEGMVWIPKGEFSMGAVVNGHGSSEMAMPSNDAEPVHRVRVDGFWMDKTTVTNEEFAKFVAATGYVTIAERTPTKEEFPNAPAENLVAGSVVFDPPDHEVPLNDHFQWWSYLRGANWRHPLGSESDIKGKDKYPVVQVAYPDAEAMRNGPGNACRPRRNLNSPRAAAYQERPLSGATNFVPEEIGWQTLTKENSR